MDGGPGLGLVVLRAARELWKEGEVTSDELALLVVLSKEREWRFNPQHLLSAIGTAPVPPYAELMLRVAQEAHPQVSVSAIAYLGQWKAIETAPGVAGLLEHHEPWIQSGAMSTLAAMGAEAYIPKIAGFLRNPNPTLREAAVMALGRMRARKHAGEVALLLTDPEPQVREEAVESLRDMKAKDQASKLAPLLTADSPLRGQAARAILELGAVEHAEKVAALLSDPSAEVRKYAAWGLGWAGVPAHGPAVAALLDDPNRTVRGRAAWALGWMGAREYAPDLVDLMWARRDDVRESAAHALARLGGPAEADEVVACLKQGDKHVRMDAAWVLGKLGTKKHLDPLKEALGDDEIFVLERVLPALGELGARVLAEEDRRALAARLRKFGGIPHLYGSLRAGALVSILRLDQMNEAEERKLLDELSARPAFLKGASMRSVDVLNSFYEPESYEKLTRRFAPQRPIETLDDVKRLFRSMGLALEADRHHFFGRVGKGVPTSGNALLELVREYAEYTVVVIEGTTVRVVYANEAVAYWRERLKK